MKSAGSGCGITAELNAVNGRAKFMPLGLFWPIWPGPVGHQKERPAVPCQPGQGKRTQPVGVSYSWKKMETAEWRYSARNDDKA